MLSSLYSAFGGWTGPAEGSGPQREALSSADAAAKQQQQQEGGGGWSQAAAGAGTTSQQHPQLSAEDSDEVRQDVGLVLQLKLQACCISCVAALGHSTLPARQPLLGIA